MASSPCGTRTIALVTRSSEPSCLQPVVPAATSPSGEAIARWKYATHGVNTSHLLCWRRSMGEWRSAWRRPRPHRRQSHRHRHLQFDRAAHESVKCDISACYRTRGDRYDAASPDDRAGVSLQFCTRALALHRPRRCSGSATTRRARRTHPHAPSGHGSGTSYYDSPHEDFLGGVYPFGWRATPMNGWGPAVSQRTIHRRPRRQERSPVSLRTIRAASSRSHRRHHRHTATSSTLGASSKAT